MSLGADRVVVRTPFEDFLVRIRRGGPSPGKEQLELARWAASQFRFGIEMGDSGAVRAAQELVRLLDGDILGLGHAVGFTSDLEGGGPLDIAFGGIAARLERELLAGRLVVERRPVAPLTDRRDIAVPDLPPLPPAKPIAPGESFIAVRLLDQGGAAVIGRPFQIELPDGSVHRGLTDPTGFGRVAGFREAGKARVSFPMLDERDFSSKSAAERLIIPVDGEDPDEEVNEENISDERDEGDEPLEAPEDPDAPSSTPTSFEVLVVDPTGGPVAGLQMSLSFPDEEQVALTDDSGVARFVDAKGRRKGQAQPTDIVQARSLLRPRFQQGLVPTAPTVTENDTTIVRALSSRFEPVEVHDAAPRTIALVPYVACHQVPGANFEFGRSFVRSTAITQLAEIAEALRDTSDVRAMIFGHTDLSGGDALNKELSERRAHAVHALLTHDSVAWEALFSGTADGANWKEKWDLEEAQKMLNALGVTDDSGAPLIETGKRDRPTTQAIHRFERDDFPDVPLEQQPLAESDTLGVDGRRALFLAYAKRISRQPIAPDRFALIGGSPFMGCGEFNPFSLSVRDEASRRVHVFVFDPVAEPDSLPCRLRDLAPCRANIGPPLSAPNDDGSPPFRCRIFRGLASKCTAEASPDLSHDLVIRFPKQLRDANQLTHKYTLEADDGTLTIERSLADDARAGDDTMAELSFEHLPEIHRYKLTCDDGESPPYIVFDFATLKDLQRHFRSDFVALDLQLSDDFATHLTQAPDPVGSDDGSNVRADGTNVNDPEEPDDDDDEDDEANAP